jgi:hypothetical protein
MPIYFSEQAPTCPISTDSSTGPRQAYLFNRPIFIRPTIPRVPSNASLNDVVQVANIARSIVTSLTNNRVINNVQPPRPGSLSAAKDKNKNKTARWVEQTNKRVKERYKYFGKDKDGHEDLASYVIMERIARMVWYDRAWKSYLTWEYGDKGEGEKVVSGNKTMRELQG